LKQEGGGERAEELRGFGERGFEGGLGAAAPVLLRRRLVDLGVEGLRG